MRLVLPCLSLWLVACTGLDSYATEDDEIYRGAVVGTTEADCTAEPCSFIRRGFPEGLELDLIFDPAEASSAPGNLTTRETTCGRFFTSDPLLPITPLAHDDLSLFEFPGARLQNYIFAVRPARGPLQGRDVMVFLSLRDDGEVELRIVSGSGARACDPEDCEAFARGDCDVFGVFQVQKTLR